MHKINLCVTTVVYITIEAPGETPEAALSAVRKDIEAKGWDSIHWSNPDWSNPAIRKVDWESADNLRAESAD